jgi:hypothetical protein
MEAQGGLCRYVVQVCTAPSPSEATSAMCQEQTFATAAALVKTRAPEEVHYPGLFINHSVGSLSNPEGLSIRGINSFVDANRRGGVAELVVQPYFDELDAFTNVLSVHCCRKQRGHDWQVVGLRSEVEKVILDLS